jgi:hypothetical protein
LAILRPARKPWGAASSRSMGRKRERLHLRRGAVSLLVCKEQGASLSRR